MSGPDRATVPRPATVSYDGDVMKRSHSRPLAAFLLTLSLGCLGATACGSDDPEGGGGSGASSSGGGSTGGSSTGGQAPGGGGSGGDGSGGEATGGHAPATLGSVSPAALNAELAAKDFLLVNVHIPYEGEIPGTDDHVPFNDIPALTSYLGADLEVAAVLYCKSDFMSVTAGEELAAMGYSGLRYLEGGMTAWEAAGYPLTP